MSDPDDADAADGADAEADLAAAVERFLDGATAVYEEYDQGYVDADSALSVLERHVEELRSASEREE